MSDLVSLSFIDYLLVNVIDFFIIMVLSVHTTISCTVVVIPCLIFDHSLKHPKSLDYNLEQISLTLFMVPWVMIWVRYILALFTRS